MSDIYRTQLDQEPYEVFTWSCPYNFHRYDEKGKMGEKMYWDEFFKEKLNEAYSKGYSLISQSIVREYAPNPFYTNSPEYAGFRFIGIFLKMK